MNGVPRTIARKLDWQLDLDRSRSLVHDLLQSGLLGPTTPQLSVNSRSGSLDPLYEGTGRATFPESEFACINREFLGSAFEELLEKAPCRIGRVRLMYLEPRRSYSFHRDDSERVHFAIDTNDQSFLLLEAGPTRLWKVHIPANGSGYAVNTQLTHTAINGGSTPRIHLLINVRSPLA